MTPSGSPGRDSNVTPDASRGSSDVIPDATQESDVNETFKAQSLPTP